MRRSADALKAPTYVEDKDSGELRRPHHIDLKTGMYRGRQVLTKKRKRGVKDAPRLRTRSDDRENMRRKLYVMFALGFPLLLVPFAIYNIIAF